MPTSYTKKEIFVEAVLTGSLQLPWKDCTFLKDSGQRWLVVDLVWPSVGICFCEWGSSYSALSQDHTLHVAFKAVKGDVTFSMMLEEPLSWKSSLLECLLSFPSQPVLHFDLAGSSDRKQKKRGRGQRRGRQDWWMGERVNTHVKEGKDHFRFYFWTKLENQSKTNDNLSQLNLEVIISNRTCKGAQF